MSHNNCSVKRAEKILSLVRVDGDTKRDHQESWIPLPVAWSSDLEHYRVQLEEVNQAIEMLMPEFDCTLMTMPGIELITAANMLSEIGNISRFPNSAKLAEIRRDSASELFIGRKGKDVCPKQGNRRLQAIFLLLAIQMIQVSINGTSRNPGLPGVYFCENWKTEEINSRH